MFRSQLCASSRHNAAVFEMLDGHGLPPFKRSKGKGCHSFGNAKRAAVFQTVPNRYPLKKHQLTRRIAGSALRPRARAFVIAFTLSLLTRHLGGYCGAIAGGTHHRNAGDEMLAMTSVARGEGGLRRNLSHHQSFSSEIFHPMGEHTMFKSLDILERMEVVGSDDK
jgi:hypothetical protein